MGLNLTNRHGWWHATGTVAGQRIRQGLGTRDRREAEELRAALEARAFKRRVYGDAAVVTFEDAALAYMKAGGERRFLAPLLRHFKGRQLAAIKPGDVRDAATACYPDAGPATWNRQAITPARAVINFGHDRGWCAPIRVRRFAVRKPARQAVGRAWVDAVRAECRRRHRPYLAALMLFLYQTGARVGEAVALTPRDLNLMAATALARDTKNGDDREIALTTEIVVELANLPPRGGRVFGYRSRQSVYGVLRRVCAAAGVEYLGTHQPGRHSFATTLVEEHGFSAETVADAGGWKSRRLVSETYVHPERANRRAAAAMDGTNMTQARHKGPA